jgi:Glycerophosphoryl diester phosphodiesterase
MYLADDDRRKGVLAELSSFINYCHENHITSFSTSVKIYNANTASYMKQSGLFAFVFTTDDEDVAKILLEMGADMVGTNFLEE